MTYHYYPALDGETWGERNARLDKVVADGIVARNAPQAQVYRFEAWMAAVFLAIWIGVPAVAVVVGVLSEPTRWVVVD